MTSRVTAIACAFGMLFANLATADVLVNFGTSAPTYSTTLNFDEAGGPTGPISGTEFQGLGISNITSGDGGPNIDLWSSINNAPWIGTGNSFFGNFGVFINFDEEISEFSAGVWDPSGDPSPFGGGLGVFLFNDGVSVYDAFVEGLVAPAWGGLGDDRLNITTTGGDVFDEIRIVGLGNFPTTFVDDLSWNAAAVPEPTSAVIISMVGLVGLMRRRK